MNIKKALFPAVVIGWDRAGLSHASHIVNALVGAGIKVVDCGEGEYPDVAKQVGKQVTDSDGACGMLVCGTGIGMAIAACKVSGVRAAICHDGYSARMSREHNDSNVLCMGALVTGLGVLEQMVEIFLTTEFAGGRHADRVKKIRSSNPSSPPPR
eukprot:Sspe_Gene.51535::Locus_28611_Transcript_1_3_Confidence_0.400_Length_2340::g.51535::m.51535/K01808/rpiB; ribose 5-phosphate isomerase B